MISRGDIYYADLGSMFKCEQGGVRPVVVIQNDKGNAFSPTTIIAPITSKAKPKTLLPTHYLITYRGLKSASMILFEQVRTIDKSRLLEYIGHMRESDINAIDQKIAISLGIKKDNL